MAEAERGAFALIQHLKHNPADTPIVTKDIVVEAWLKQFITLDDNPRAAQLIGERYPYSPNAIDIYRRHFETHIQGTHF
jgi:hypothetical protein